MVLHESDGPEPIVAVLDAEPEEYLPMIEAVVPPGALRLCRTPEDVRSCAPDAEVVLAFKFTGRPFPREALFALERVRWVQLAGAGIDHMLPFDPTRLVVTNASGIHGSTMAEYVIAWLVHVRWDFERLRRQQRAHHWAKYDVPSLQDLTMAIVGAGRVGQAIGRHARLLGMRVIGTRRRGNLPVEGFDELRPSEEMGEVLAKSDVVVVTVPLTPATRGLIGARELESCKAGTLLVNVSRGGVVDEAALTAALASGRVAAAVLDVFDQEPLPAGHPFWDMPQVVVTPHISSEFAGWRTAVATLFLDNLARWRRHEPLRNVVDPALGY